METRPPLPFLGRGVPAFLTVLSHSTDAIFTPLQYIMVPLSPITSLRWSLGLNGTPSASLQPASCTPDHSFQVSFLLSNSQAGASVSLWPEPAFLVNGLLGSQEAQVLFVSAGGEEKSLCHRNGAEVDEVSKTPYVFDPRHCQALHSVLAKPLALAPGVAISIWR
jgi:hypothetical protein